MVAERPNQISICGISVANRGAYGHSWRACWVRGLARRCDSRRGNSALCHRPGAGSYEFSCRIVVQTDNGTLVDHSYEGMTTTVRVGSA